MNSDVKKSSVIFKMSIHKELYATEWPGFGLDTKLEIHANNNLDRVIGSLLDQVEQELNADDFSFTSVEIVGLHYKGKIRIFNSSKTVKEHENAHREVFEAFPGVNHQKYKSFNESQAYARADSLHKNGSAEGRCELSRGLRGFLYHAGRRSLDGGLTSEDTEVMESLIEKSSLKFKKSNWAAFLISAHDFQFYDLFFNLYAKFGYERGKEEVLNCTKIMSESGNLLEGLNYIAELCDRDLVGDPLPVWSDGMFNNGPLLFDLRNEECYTSIKAWSKSHKAVGIIRKGLAEHYEELKKHLNGTYKIGFREDIFNYVKKANPNLKTL